MDLEGQGWNQQHSFSYQLVKMFLEILYTSECKFFSVKRGNNTQLNTGAKVILNRTGEGTLQLVVGHKE